MSDDGNMGMGQWWNNADRGKMRYWEKNLFERHLPHSGSYMDRSGIEPGLLRKEVGN
jgi:hypothetical protein